MSQVVDQQEPLNEPSDSRAAVLPGMGAIPHKTGVAFRVWAPHATAVFVNGTFNEWSKDSLPMTAEDNGTWYVDVEGAKFGDEYRFLIHNGELKLSKIDPYAKAVTNSIGNAIVHDPTFEWTDEDFQRKPLNELVIYEMHVGTFRAQAEGVPGDLENALSGLGHLKRLGVNALEVMPLAEFAGDFSWGYNPAHIFAVETTYGGPNAFKAFVNEAHRQGFSVILDVVYNHFGPSDLDLWQFDGWSENDGGGIYFYNDWRKETPWGATRPDYGREEVRRYILDNARMWLEEYHVDGLRMDMTLFVRSVHGNGDPGNDLADGWRLMRDINTMVRNDFPGRYTFAEDLHDDPRLTAQADQGGGAFYSQWCAQFVHTVRAAVITPDDANRPLEKVCDALKFTFNGDAHQRVIYSESHDEVANGKARVPQEINPDDHTDYYAQKRSTLAAGLVLTAPGVPMLFQGQEFLEGGWFRDTVPLDWDLNKDYRGIVRLYRDLIKLRLNADGVTKGLLGGGMKLFHCDLDRKVIAYQRWFHHGPQDDVVVVCNFQNAPVEGYELAFPSPGLWRLRLSSDWEGYSADFGNTLSLDLTADPEPLNDFPARAKVSIGPYSLLVFSQDAEQPADQPADKKA